MPSISLATASGRSCAVLLARLRNQDQRELNEQESLPGLYLRAIESAVPEKPKSHLNQIGRWPERFGARLAVHSKRDRLWDRIATSPKNRRMPYNRPMVVIIGTSPHSGEVLAFGGHTEQMNNRYLLAVKIRHLTVA
jgi:hypothetical protein